MSISWKNPPSVLVMGGSEQFLVQREIRNAKLSCYSNGIQTERVSTDSEIVDILTSCATFGDTRLIHVDISVVTLETVKECLENPTPKVCLLIECTKELPTHKKCEWLSLVPKKHVREQNVPKRQADRVKVAKRFFKYECDRLMEAKDSIVDNLVNAVVSVVGVELGVLAFEASKYALCAKYNGSSVIDQGVVKALVKSSDDLDLNSLRLALKSQNKKELAKSLYKVRVKSTTDPTMLMLRGKGAPLDVLYSLLLVKQCQKKKMSTEEIASRLGIPLWILKKDLITTASKWNMSKLKKLVYQLSELECNILKGCPNAWVACETILLQGI